MRTLITLALVAASTALVANGNSSQASAWVGVKIVSPILIGNPNQSKLNFGVVTVADAGQPIALKWEPDVNGAGVMEYTNADPYANGANPTKSFAWFHLRKDHDLAWSNVNIDVPATVDLGSGVMVATKSSPLGPCGTLYGFPPFLSNTTYDDIQHFFVGGTLTAPANTFGNFSGTLTVTASYQ